MAKTQLRSLTNIVIPTNRIAFPKPCEPTKQIYCTVECMEYVMWVRMYTGTYKAGKSGEFDHCCQLTMSSESSTLQCCSFGSNRPHAAKSSMLPSSMHNRGDFYIAGGSVWFRRTELLMIAFSWEWTRRLVRFFTDPARQTFSWWQLAGNRRKVFQVDVLFVRFWPSSHRSCIAKKATIAVSWNGTRRRSDCCFVRSVQNDPAQQRVWGFQSTSNRRGGFHVAVLFFQFGPTSCDFEGLFLAWACSIEASKRSVVRSWAVGSWFRWKRNFQHQGDI